MLTKPFGIIMIIIGIIILSYAGYKEIFFESVDGAGLHKIKTANIHRDNWSPLIGTVLLIGGIVLLARKKNIHD